MVPFLTVCFLYKMRKWSGLLQSFKLCMLTPPFLLLVQANPFIYILNFMFLGEFGSSSSSLFNSTFPIVSIKATKALKFSPVHSQSQLQNSFRSGILQFLCAQELSENQFTMQNANDLPTESLIQRIWDGTKENMFLTSISSNLNADGPQIIFLSLKKLYKFIF